MKRVLPNDEWINRIKCPICSSEVDLVEKGSVSIICRGPRKHCYDLSAKGYVNLLSPRHTVSGDSKEAVMARRDFLSLEYYRPAANALAEVISNKLGGSSFVIDAGCGEGYYTSVIAEKGFNVAGVDISRFAVEAAAKRCHSKGSDGFFAVGSVYELPFSDSSADCIVNVFAPCVEKEFCRVLRKNGLLVVVYAGQNHLMGLKRIIYDNVRENDGRADMPSDMTLLEERAVTFDITVDGQESIQNLFSMTPYYWRTSPTDSEKLKNIEKLTTAVDMRIAVYVKE